MRRVSGLGRVVLLAMMAVSALGVRCDPPTESAEIGRERAIEIARQEVNPDTENVEAVRLVTEGRPVWRVTFKWRLPDQPPELFETRIVEIDARTGKIVSVSMN